MSNLLRSFLAVDLPASAVEEITKVQSLLKSSYPRWRWVAPANLHLTLHFLGDKTPEELAEIVKHCLPILSGQKPVEVETGELGVFPNWLNPRVLWLSLEDKLGIIRMLQRKTGDILHSLGHIPDKKPFSPHITLARIHKDEYPVDAGLIRLAVRDKTGFTIDSATLYTSILKPQGPVYTAYYRFNLTNHN